MIVRVQSMHRIKFLAIVLILLLVRILNSRNIRIWRTEWIVVRHLNHIAAWIHYLPVIAEMILVVIVKGKSICICPCCCRLTISALKQVFVYLAILQYKTSSKKVYCFFRGKAVFIRMDSRWQN